MKRIIAALIMVMSATAWADDFDDGVVAYESGDYAKSVAKFESSARNGSFYAKFALIKIYNQSKTLNPEEATRWIQVVKVRAENGDPSAQFIFGLLHLKYELQNSSPEEALRWIKLAAQQGYPGAQVLMGQFTDTGERVPRNGYEAARWFKLAAEQGVSYAQYRYAMSLESWLEQKSMNRGWPQIGAPQDLVKAYMWTYLSTSAGYVGWEICWAHYHGPSVYCINRPIEGSWPLHLKSNLARLESKMTQSQIREALGLVTKCYEQNYKNCE